MTLLIEVLGSEYNVTKRLITDCNRYELEKYLLDYFRIEDGALIYIDSLSDSLCDAHVSNYDRHGVDKININIHRIDEDK